MNIDVKIDGKSVPGFATRRRGTTDQCSMKGSPPLNSTKKNRMLRAIRTNVTTGTVLRALSSSPIGNMLRLLPQRIRLGFLDILYQENAMLKESSTAEHFNNSAA